jgi:Cu/Ag efflux pump CusA
MSVFDRIIDFSLRQKIVAIALVLLMAIGGISSLTKTPLTLSLM